MKMIAVIAVGGEYGTLSEIASALKLGLPVIGLDTWQLARQGRLDAGILPARTPEEAVTLALQHGWPLKKKPWSIVSLIG